MKAPLAVVTMVYNEPDFLPPWCRYYSAQVPAHHCYVVDHGSDDGSTETLGAINRIRLPRSSQDDERRARAISDLAASLLGYYDAVLYTDVDEIVVADPARFAGLVAFAQSSNAPATVATGLDIIHVPDDEPRLDWSRPILAQRRWARFSSAMCKPVLIREPALWAPGFHSIAGESRMDDALFLFHLRYADLDSGLERLQRTRAQAWADERAGQHQRMQDDIWASMLRSMAGLPKIDDTDFSPADRHLGVWRDKLRASMRGREHDRYTLDLHLSGDALWRVPDRFVGQF